MKTYTPKRTDLPYLIGWFKAALRTNDARKAKAAALEYLAQKEANPKSGEEIGFAGDTHEG